jgi:hypothetical protein
MRNRPLLLPSPVIDRRKSPIIRTPGELPATISGESEPGQRDWQRGRLCSRAAPKERDPLSDGALPRNVATLTRHAGTRDDARRRYRRQSSASARVCSRCELSLPLDSFRLDSRGFTRSHCRACQLLDSQDWRARNHDALLARRRDARHAVRRSGLSPNEAGRQ